MLDSENRFLNTCDLHIKYGITTDVMKYNSFISALLSAKRNNPDYIGIFYDSIADINFESNIIKPLDQKPLSLENRSIVFYDILIKSKRKKPTNWDDILDTGHKRYPKNHFMIVYPLLERAPKKVF